MQNDKSNKFTRMWKEKGYYIILSLCIVAVGVSGYFFITGAREEQASLSVPVTVEKPADEKTPVTTTTPAEEKTTEQPKPEQSAPASAETELTDASAEEPLAVMPVNGSVTQDYAMDHLTYHATTQDWRVHNGVDLSAAVGSTVKAARAGTVTAVYEDEYYGTTVVIQHDNGYTSHSCNLAAETQVAAGDLVAAGDVIGTIGQTALIETAEEPHLHFEVYQNGEPVDPAGFLY